MSGYFFDDSKEFAFDDEADLRRRVFSPRTSPGKVTLTSRLTPRGRPLPPNTQSGPVQRKTAPSSPTATSQKTAGWMQAAFRPDLHQPLDAEPATRPNQQGRQPTPDRSVATSARSGTTLPEDVQAQMESAFGADFSAVRIHEGPQASAAGALAYTQGTDIHFQPGQYDPHSLRGRELLGHELTHVVQQSRGRVPSPTRTVIQQTKARANATSHAGLLAVNEDSGLEREADEFGALAARGARVPGAGSLAGMGPMASRAGIPAALPGSPSVSPMQLKTDPSISRDGGQRSGSEQAGEASDEDQEREPTEAELAALDSASENVAQGQAEKDACTEPEAPPEAGASESAGGERPADASQRAS